MKIWDNEEVVGKAHEEWSPGSEDLLTALLAGGSVVENILELIIKADITSTAAVRRV